MAERGVADLIVNSAWPATGWRRPSISDAEWQLDSGIPAAKCSVPPAQRPATGGMGTAGAAALGARRPHIDWMPVASRAPVPCSAVGSVGTRHGGFFYTLDWPGQPLIRTSCGGRCARGSGRALLNALRPSDPHRGLVPPASGFHRPHALSTTRTAAGIEELEDSAAAHRQLFSGKPDIYHALQACLIPLLPADRQHHAGPLPGCALARGARLETPECRGKEPERSR